MKLKKILQSLDSYKALGKINDFEIKGITCDSNKVDEDFLFVAVKGVCLDGHSFIKQAIKRGAKAIIAEKLSINLHGADNIAFIEVRDSRSSLAELAACFYNYPSSKLKIVGVTGTNGKTTITYLLEAILKEAGFNPAVIGTVNYRFNDKIIPSKNTTPGPVELQAMLKQMGEENCDYAVMEVSSHALDQQRIKAINFHSAIFTNLGQEHLDYHKNTEEYFKAKARLFRELMPGSFAVINNDDEYAQKLKEITSAEKIFTYGLKKESDITAGEIKSGINGIQFKLKKFSEEINLSSRLIGNHNLYNILACIAWAIAEKIDFSCIQSVIEEFNYIPGRLEKIDSSSGFSIFVDYAHTPEALSSVLSALRSLAKARIIVVFGCGGERDKSKRPGMGRVATQLADYVIITSDNPRSENPAEIISDIRKGIKKRNYCIIPNRKEAIVNSLALAKREDIILVAGKGHEDYQVFKDKRIHFDDRQVIRECLKLLNS
ncbi:MAG: UDP-N-acetylmuramoyl-L-alanyl-D-glutamate--2,6-diaminopimelate ligase [Candidatus Omnitrophota bacterium]|nr:MAG: UDP-N-acetylmuramoyl-L-alanyl-D-glutamate--2,6-diaminopimelate ligase [Candidatus Omnitrophota bacterium]